MTLALADLGSCLRVRHPAYHDDYRVLCELMYQI